MNYAAPEGHPRLREALATMLASTRGLAITAANMGVTRGSQQAIFLVARALVRPGDVVVVEQLGYRPAWEAIRSVGAEIVGVPIDGDGLSIDALERLLADRKIRALYLTHLGIFREMFDVDRHVSEFSISLLTYSRSGKQKRMNLEMFYAGLAGR